MPQQSFDCYDIFTQLYKKIQTRTTCTGLYTYHGGDGGNRTPVRKVFALTFSERSQCFESPLPRRPLTGYAARQLLMCDRSRSTPLFTFTSDRRPLCGRGPPHRDELHQAAKATVFLSVILSLRILWRFRTAARLSGFALPVEAFTSPYIAKLSASQLFDFYPLPCSFMARSMSRLAVRFAISSRLS